MKKIVKNLRHWNRFFCTGMTCKTNLKRDLVIIAVVIVFSTAILTINLLPTDKFFSERGSQEMVTEEAITAFSDEQVYEEVRSVQETIMVDNWQKFQSQWYGIAVKYPENWPTPSAQKITLNAKWEYRYNFRKPTVDAEKYAGFDLVVYNLVRTKELTNTDEFPPLKFAESSVEKKCETATGHIIETGDYPAEEIYIPAIDDCYAPALFFSFTRGEYMYNLTPMLAEGQIAVGDPMVEALNNFPEFFAAASTLEMTDIVRPKPVPVKPKISAPKPFAATKKDSLGRRVCKKKNDRPSKSSQRKKKHLDMECCLDPDEYPNPHCYYSPGKYGKYL